MKINTMLIRHFRHLTAFCAMIAVFSVSSMVALAGTGSKTATGEISVSAVSGDNAFAMLNGERAITGQTLFSDSNIATTENSTANIKLGKLGFVTLMPNSNLNLTFGDNKISGNLIAGQVKVIGSDGVEVKIQTPDGVIGNRENQAATFTVDLQSGAAQAIADSGAVFLTKGDTSVPVANQQADDDDNNHKGSFIPLLVFAGIVATAVIVVFVNRDNNDNNSNVISPFR